MIAERGEFSLHEKKISATLCYAENHLLYLEILQSKEYNHTIEHFNRGTIIS